MPVSKQSTKITKNSDQLISEQYQKMEPHEHILALPDTYIGGVELDSHKMWVHDKATDKLEFKNIEFVPGLYKIFDEIVVNARDHSVNDITCTNIKINFDQENGIISCWNDGNKGIPVAIHPKHKMYVPEMIFGVLLTSGNYRQKGKTVGGRNGYGSKACCKKGTEVPMFDGKVKKIEDIKIGEKIIGDDGTSRKVLNKTEGTSKLFEISQQSYNPYTVNEEHVLCLRMSDHKVIFWNDTKKAWSMQWLNKQDNQIKHELVPVGKRDSRICSECGESSSNINRHYKRMHKNVTVPKIPRKKPTLTAPDTQEVKDGLLKMKEIADAISDDNTIDINVRDYMKLNSTTKMRLTGYIGKCVQWSSKKVELDPYVLGLWLGDGFQHGYGFAINAKDDPEILEYLEKWGDDNDATFTQGKNNNIISYSISSKTKSGVAPLKKLLKKYNLVDNKHIPKEYMVNSKDIRMKVLAGLIDSDGSCTRDGTRINISQGMNHTQLAKDIVSLARSLGLMCNSRIQNTQWSYLGELKRGKAFNMNISGEEAVNIPTIVPRKKCCSTVKKDTTSTGNLKIKELEEGEFVGLAIDGNQRFVLNDYTVTHNCNIFSSEFYVEVGDKERKLVFKQQFTDNMYTKNDCQIIKQSVPKSYTMIRFKPDFKRFGISGLTDEVVTLFNKRVYDIAATTRESVNVYLNDEKLKINTFEKYVDMYYDDDEDDEEADNQSFKNRCVFETVNDRWDVCAVYDPVPGYRHISYANGICTFKGGKHVEYITNQVIKGLADHIAKKNKDLRVKTAHIKDNLTIFVNAVIEDPSFSSQIKEELANKVSNFGSECKISDAFIAKLAKTGIVEEIMNFAKLKAMAEMKKTDGKKRSNLKGIEKLVDAHNAGSRNSEDCRLFLTEGDSAKAFALYGMDVIGKDNYGVFPLKGKLLNVREAKISQLMNNEEIKSIKQIMGLKQGKKYKNTKELRYGGIIILTDQDTDGSHIKGLLINFIHYFWPSLLNIDGFIQSMATPIVKAWKTPITKTSVPKIFYTLTDFDNWKQEIGTSIGSWKTKYYKGLGTSKEKEAKESFIDFEKRIIDFVWDEEGDKDTLHDVSDDENVIEDVGEEGEEDVGEGEEGSVGEEDEKTNNGKDDEEEFTCDKQNKNYDAITLAFSKIRANDRKKWLKNYDKNNIVENDVTSINYHEFVNKELIHFSNYDCIRSIPSMIDGLKPGKRKIMYISMNHNLYKKEMKVAQLAGYVSAEAAYHHGEVSLQETIIGMAQNHVGSNNLNLLVPNGHFGSRKQGGKDNASPRYIFTQLTELVPQIFRKEDNKILSYVLDDGSAVEPEYYATIIPIVLVNGTNGIGTGFSTFVPCYNPSDIISNIRLMINEKEQKTIKPWYRGFHGSIVKLNNNVFRTCGKISDFKDSSIRITELPVGIWTDKYVSWLETMIADDKKNVGKGQILDSIKDDCGNNSISITIKFLPGILQKLIKTGKLEKTLKLWKNIGTTNMHLYNSKNVIQKYHTVQEIFTEFYNERLHLYTKRKTHYLKILENDMNMLKYKIQFLKYVIDNTIVVLTKNKNGKNIAEKEETILQRVADLKFPKLHNDAFADEHKLSYSYLTNIKFFDITPENMDKLEDEFNKINDKYEIYKNTPEKQMWLTELDELEVAYNKWSTDQEDEKNSDSKIGKKKKTIKKKK
jgi:DNA topoisomerase-2